MRISSGLLSAVVICGFSGVEARESAAQIPPPVEISTQESAIVDSSAIVVREIMSIPGKGIPASLLADAEGLVIVPGMLKGGFVVGVKHGRGVVLVRDPAARWQLPQFITIAGGSVGWQAGIQATDLVLVFKTKKSVQGLLTGKFTIGADAAVSAGPIGREASAGTDGKLQAEIYSYSRSRGLFAGLALDGSRLEIDREATDAYYRPQVAVPPGQPAPLPASSLRLVQEVSQYTVRVAVGQPIAVENAPVAAANPQEVRRQLGAASQRLGGLLDEPWRAYLALPAETYGGDRLPAFEALEQAAGRFQAVASNPQFAALASRPEFVETSGLLRQLLAVTPRPTLVLPPPPQ